MFIPFKVSVLFSDYLDFIAKYGDERCLKSYVHYPKEQQSSVCYKIVLIRWHASG